MIMAQGGLVQGQCAVSDVGINADIVVCHQARELPTISVDNFVEKYLCKASKAMLDAG